MALALALWLRDISVSLRRQANVHPRTLSAALTGCVTKGVNRRGSAADQQNKPLIYQTVVG
jgi:hypothetical protein